MINQESLEMTDGDGPILFDPFAFPFTGVRAGIGKDSGEGQFFPDEFKGLLELAHRDQGNISLGIDMERAGGTAGRSPPLFDSIGARHGLGKELVDGGTGDQSLLVIIRNFNRADLGAVPAGLAVFKGDGAGLFVDEDLEVSGFSFDLLHLCIGEDLDVPMTARIDQLGRHDAHGAVIGREGLVELGHGPANADVLLQKVDLEAGFSEVERGLDASDSSTHDQDCADRIFPMCDGGCALGRLRTGSS